jgi:hypothetical protein
MSNSEKTGDLNFLSRFNGTNTTSDDKNDKRSIRQPCKYFNTKSGCKNGSMCKFLHESIDNWRNIIKAELSPEEEIREEIKFAIINRQLNDIFKKMVTSNDDYQKYYSDMEKQFRGVATWKLMKKSIKVELINTIHSKNVELDDGILPYGYIPLCLFFIFSGLSWKIFDGASDNASQFEIESCIDEVIDIVSGMYSNEDYKENIRTVTLYCNPTTYATLGHITTSNLCDTIMSHIKKQLSSEDFNTFLEQKTNKEETLRDWFEENKENNNEKNMQRYKWKYDGLIKNARGNTEKLALAKKIYDYNISKIVKWKTCRAFALTSSSNSSPCCHLLLHIRQDQDPQHLHMMAVSVHRRLNPIKWVALQVDSQVTIILCFQSFCYCLSSLCSLSEITMMRQLGDSKISREV